MKQLFIVSITEPEFKQKQYYIVMADGKEDMKKKIKEYFQGLLDRDNPLADINQYKFKIENKKMKQQENPDIVCIDYGWDDIPF